VSGKWEFAVLNLYHFCDFHFACQARECKD